MIRAPAFVWNSDGPPMAHADSVRADSLRAETQALTASPDLEQYRRALPYLLARDGALGIIADGAKEFTLLTMSGSPAALYPLPSFVLPHDTYAMIYRLIEGGERVSLRADIANSLGRDTVDISNTVAELRGTEKPGEVVLIGAHLDSWDLGTGATDNGAGAIAVLEAARILRAANVHSARTIRFVLFTGEEEGLFGSEEYAARHGAELRRYQAVLVLDNGTGRITGVSLQGRNELRDLWQSLFASITALGPFVVQSRNKGGTDHLSFIPYGVPAFNFDQESRGYGHTHHSQADTYDHIVAGDVRQAATVMAVTAYELAGLPELLGRGPVSVVVGQP
jgi:Iap family predicted aminopeptidase